MFLIIRQLKVASVIYWPQFLRRLSLALRRLYQGILLFTWWGTCTLMSWVRNSTHAGKSQCTVPASCACAAFQDSAGLKGMCGAVWWITVKVLIQKWYPSHGMSQYLARPAQPVAATTAGSTPKANAAHASQLTYTLLRCLSVNLEMSKCHSAQWPTDAHSLRGVPRKNLKILPLGDSPQSFTSSCITGCHAVSSTNLLVWAWWWLCLMRHGSKG
mmetsp:Transcript_1490/g.4417  ORF Transcript_1490/g.4417 Transcript_1490/m.4417 type:complete len:215 (+) Transcript_1490:582-1226(+)